MFNKFHKLLDNSPKTMYNIFNKLEVHSFMTLGQLIKEYREKNNLSQRQFANISNVSNGYISMLEEGKNPKTKGPIVPSIITMKKLSVAMNMTIDELFCSIDDMPVKLSAASVGYLLTEEEVTVVEAYRAQPEVQTAVKRVLGLEDGSMYIAAQTKPNNKYVKQKLKKADPELSAKLHNAPIDTDDIL